MRAKIPSGEEFILKAQVIHNNKYDYSLVEYVNTSTKVKLICKEHGIFDQTPNNHISLHQGCPKCVGRLRSTEDFVYNANKVHNHRYDYSLVNYTTATTKITIICLVHGEFRQTPNNHVSLRQGCPICAGKHQTTETFIRKAGSIHNNKYDYSFVGYKSTHTKVKIICPEHGLIEQTPLRHMRGHGCPKCATFLATGGYSTKRFTNNPELKSLWIVVYY